MKLAIIGGSGLDNPDILTDFNEIDVDTPFGKPSAKLIAGKINNVEVVILARHGKDHSIMPTKVPFRANIWALKQAGCTHILATTACGSLQERIKPGDFVFIDQFVDFTKHRALTFFDNDPSFANASAGKQVIHTPMAEPFDAGMRAKLIEAAKKLNLSFHEKGTVITIEGPRFSTKAESVLFKSWNIDVINMSTVPEVILANELKIPYQSIAMTTDYDCWKDNEAPVTWEMIVERMKVNAENVKKLILEFILSQF